MTVELERLGRLRVYQQSTYTDASGVGGMLDVDALEDTIKPSRPQKMLPVKSVAQRRLQYPESVLGPKSSALDFSWNLVSHGLDLDGDVAVPTASTWWQATIMKTMMGGIDTETIPAAQTTVQAGTTATVVNVTAGHGARFKKGVAIGCVVPASGGGTAYECREVLSVATDAVSVKVAFSDVPTTATAVRRSVTVYRTERPATWLQFAYEGKVALDRWDFRGMQGALSYAFTWGELITASAKLMGSTWTNLGSGTLSAATYSYNTPVPMVNMELLIATVGATTRTVCPFGALSWEPEQGWIDQKGGTGSETIVQKIASRPDVAPLRVKITEPFEDLTRFTSRDSRTDHALFLQSGNTVGGTVLFAAPTGQLIEPERAPQDALAGQTWTFQAREDSAGAVSTELDLSCERLHFM